MKRTTTCWILWVFAAGFLATVISCRTPAQRGDKLLIGVAVPSLTHPFFIYLKNSLLDEAQQLRVEIVAADAEDVAAKQLSIVEDFIARGVDGVLISPIGADALVPAVEALNQAQIPVVTVDRRVSGGDVLVHVGADNVRGGQLAARYVCEQLGGRGSIIQLEGTPGASPAIDRKKGFDGEIQQSGVRIVASQTADFQRAKGQNVMENLLQVHPNIQAVYAANDEMILGALEALAAHQVDPSSVITVGYDAIPDALAEIKAGRLDATIEQYPGKQARTALRILVEHIRERKRPPSREIYFEPAVIGAGNLDQAERKDGGTVALSSLHQES